MVPKHSAVSALALGAASALVLTGCATATGTAAEDDGPISVVASTDVYGDIAATVGGDLVEVTSIISSAAQDPHSYEASARDQLTVSKADLIIENGGGYDPFIDALIDASGSEATVLTASEFSHDWPGGDAHGDSGDEHAEDEHADDEHAEDEHADDEHADDEHADDEHGHDHVEGFNEHVWYDPHAMADLALGIASQLELLSPDDADTFAANAEAFVADLTGLEDELDALSSAHAGAEVFLTEPVSFYLVEAAGLVDVTPADFSEAVEEGQDVAPATLLESLHLVSDGHVSVLITNSQTGGAETDQMIAEAEDAGIPVIAFSETLPEGQTYISWMQANIEALSTALQA
ncbi:zinc/manganese transport system substrate-binding protein [Microbacterium terrae]|uniref:Metal ABC transporter substrate-binding lipoprotein n=1 Tax=Microbacterium terrae TaxID=69369 RepID=A0A0M2HD59_9MICO|nr:zinc ABC transporter substrate-binding protein [Microbacterium terrae]KJL42624.1 Metal ABC transporter substrate-binding lipoprotein precursor [Microbacterium terrae]MBP1079054.1 zinc/manganese transport system substrate-binding protein [Microbacterium terrae]GLJ98454.1 hypothetical protein GCM10017594_16510 [Microbacterium terrae]